MSTKELIDRLTQTETRPARRAPPGATPEVKAPDQSGVETRIGTGVIRRRRVGGRDEEVRIETKPPVLERARPPIETEAPPEAEAPKTKPKRAKKAAEPEAAEAAPEAAPVAEEKKKSRAKAKPAPETPEVAPPAPPPVAVAPPPPSPRVEPPVVAKVEPSPAPVVEPAAAPIAPAVDVPSESPTQSSQLVSGLPRANVRRVEPAGGDTTPQLGKAVVRPPPGYDPNDPQGNLRRSRESSNIGGRPAAPGDTRGGFREAEKGRPALTPEGEGGDAERRRRGRGAKQRRGRVEMTMDDLGGYSRRRRNKSKGTPKTPSPQAKAIKRRIPVDETITVANLAHAMAVKSAQVIKTLIGMGQMATVNDVLDFDTAQLIAAEFEHEVVRSGFQEEEHLIEVSAEEGDQEHRPPVVTIMGHVDHGKTTLLDSIRSANVAAGEAGGITQHIGAYQIEHKNQKVTFIDTPGHEAFTAMRARGAKVTDIVVLVVAADDGVMPQTVEAINHAKDAGVAIMVAVNKVDKPGANPERVKTALMEHGLVAEEFGGETVFANVSALKGTGIPDLLDNILLIAEIGDYKANAERHAEGVVLEGRLERGRGPVASLLVHDGTLNRGEYVVLGQTWGRVRDMTDHAGTRIESAGPSTPVEIIGIAEVPAAGDDFVVVKSERDAKALVENRLEKVKRAALQSRQRRTLEDLYTQKAEEGLLELKLVIKADVDGSLEALKQSLESIAVEGTRLKIIHTGIGAVSKSDVTLAHSSDAIILGYNVRPDVQARQSADEFGVEVRNYKVIYEVLDDIRKAMVGLLGPSYKEEVIGRVEVREVFKIPKIGNIAGCMVTDGKVVRNAEARLLRDGTVVWTGKLSSLRRFKDDAREVEKGYECGIGLENFNDVKVGDQIEPFLIKEVAATA